MAFINFQTSNLNSIRATTSGTGPRIRLLGGVGVPQPDNKFLTPNLFLSLVETGYTYDHLTNAYFLSITSNLTSVNSNTGVIPVGGLVGTSNSIEIHIPCADYLVTHNAFFGQQNYPNIPGFFSFGVPPNCNAVVTINGDQTASYINMSNDFKAVNGVWCEAPLNQGGTLHAAIGLPSDAKEYDTAYIRCTGTNHYPTEH